MSEFFLVSEFGLWFEVGLVDALQAGYYLAYFATTLKTGTGFEESFSKNSSPIFSVVLLLPIQSPCVVSWTKVSPCCEDKEDSVQKLAIWIEEVVLWPVLHQVLEIYRASLISPLQLAKYDEISTKLVTKGLEKPWYQYWTT